MTDMTPLVQKLKDAKADVLIVISFINDTVLLHRKAKELDFNAPAVIGVSAGHSVPDLKDSIGTAVNGLFVSDLPVLVNPAALRPEVQAAAEEFNKRYEKVQRRVPAGHAVASFAALWTLFNDVLPKAKSIAPEDVRAAALVDGPSARQLDQWQRSEVLQFRFAERSEGCRSEHPLLDWRLAMAEPVRSPSLSKESGYQRDRDGPVAGLVEALSFGLGVKG